MANYDVPDYKDTRHPDHEKHVRMLMSSFVNSNMDACYAPHMSPVCIGGVVTNNNIKRGFLSLYRKSFDELKEEYKTRCDNVDDWFCPSKQEIDDAVSRLEAKGYTMRWSTNSHGTARHLHVVK